MVEDDVFDKYMRDLFSSSNRYIIIYSCNFDKNHARHVRCREFSNWVDQNLRNEVKLLKVIKNRYPYDENDLNNTSWSGFYVYEKI